MRKNFTRTLIGVLALCSAQALNAASYRSIVVEQNDGSRLTLSMPEGTTATFTGTTLNLSSKNGNVELPFENIKHWTYSTDEADDSGWASIDGIESTSNVKISWEADNRLAISGLDANSPVAVYDTNGRTIHSGAATNDGSASVSMGNLPKGIYIVKFGSQTAKIALR